ncbi:carbon-nitrogen hydrolase family protein [Burkholderia sp. BCC1977]|uniref:carbon-nitrogen hydrolase family protein n=1 Tax=Burkholderia sp. BCC1977 TaxID=2817440 RepID=UPI002ABE1C78|nr:carbon-nitrogen hydrolase family protein [Burkholderia sp. BCC1977]
MFQQRSPFLVAAAQLGPVYCDKPKYFDSAATLNKAVKAIAEAGKKGAKLIVFPELFLPGYPYWSVDFAHGDEFAKIWREYLYHSPTVPGPETAALCKAAQDAGIVVAMGINERDAYDEGRMYNTILWIGADGRIMGTHRKLVITVHEQYYHVQSDVTINEPGDNIRTYDTDFGRVGGLICGEHYQHLLQQNLINEGEQIHVALWPGHYDSPDPKGYSLKVVAEICTRNHSIAGQSWSILAGAYLPEDERPKNFYSNNVFDHTYGGSCIVNPGGAVVAGPIYNKEEILYAEVDLGEIPLVKSVANMKGIYDRHDVIGLVRQETPRARSRSMEASAPPVSASRGEGARFQAAENKDQPFEGLQTQSRSVSQ